MLFAVLFVTKIFTGYEAARLSMLKASIPDVQSSARQLAAAARAERQPAIAAKAEALASARDIAAARGAFAALSDEVIKFRAGVPAAERPPVAYCSMEKKSWLQPRGSIANPYVGASMRACGEFRGD